MNYKQKYEFLELTFPGAVAREIADAWILKDSEPKNALFHVHSASHLCSEFFNFNASRWSNETLDSYDLPTDLLDAL